MSSDAQHVAIVSKVKMLPNEELEKQGSSVPEVYQSDHGVLSLASILPNGKLPAEGAEVKPANYRRAMSTDGSRLVFTTRGENPQLYMRINGERTVWISEPQNGEMFEPTEVHLQAVTPDGRNVFFLTNSKLLAGDTNEGADLYRWTESTDPAHKGTLTLITDNGETVYDSILGAAVLGVSDDGTKVYYQARSNRTFVWQNGISQEISDTAKDAVPKFQLSATASAPGAGRVSPDGNWLAFVSHSTQALDEVHALTGQLINRPGEKRYEMYLYSLQDDRLICVSCQPGPPSKVAAPGASVFPQVTNAEPRIFDVGVRPNFLSDDGRVFFSSEEALLPQDTNGVADTYEYDPHTGRLSLLSPGTGSEPSMFADASPSGNDVFIVTRQQLVPEDHDSLVDLYDVRVGGGFPAPLVQPNPCVADECQPAPVPVPAFVAPSTVGFAGAGNVPPLRSAKPVAKKPGARAKALQACKRKRNRVRRRRCEAQVHKRFAGQSKRDRGSK